MSQTTRPSAAPTATGHATPPVVILGGKANALSIARSLGRRGVEVFGLLQDDSPAGHSRYCRRIPSEVAGSTPAEWADFLLGEGATSLHGAVLLAASDEGIQLLADHRSELSNRYLLDESNPGAQLQMLNKLDTYQAARAAGIPVPRFWFVHSLGEVSRLKPDLCFPLMIKPVYSHLFVEEFGCKLFTVHSFDELVGRFRQMDGTDLDVMLVEMIPGPDDRLCSYYTYLDHEGEPQFDFTKRVVRRYPPVTGNACYHVTDWNPTVREHALKLFREVRLRGLANAEFKLDVRDGQLKLIECNARFTAANCLVTSSGIDLAWMVYSRITGRPHAPITGYRRGLRLWYPLDDFKCLLRLRRRNELTVFQWLRSIGGRQTLPYFSWGDPGPSLVAFVQQLQRAWHHVVGAATRRHGLKGSDRTPQTQGLQRSLSR